MIDEQSLGAASDTPASRRGSLCRTKLTIALLMAVQGVFVAVDAVPFPATPQNTAAPPAQTTYTLSVAKEGITYVSLTAEGAKLSEIAADLSKRLSTPVIVGPSLQKETISARLSGLPLEPALGQIAPRVYVDYEIRQGAQPTPLGIFLLGYGDPEPAVNAVVRGTSQGLFVTGNTEDTGKPSADAPLQVLYDKSRLTVISKKQPLVAVVMTIGDTLAVPAEIKYETTEIVDVNIKDTPLVEDAIVGLSPNVRVYVRVDVNRLERTLLRLVIVPPAAK